MASYFSLTLDTTSPSSVTLSINESATYTTNQLVTLTIGCGDGDTTGYQMLIWGDVDNAYDTNVQTTEGTSQWITFNISKQIKLSSGDTSKIIFIKVRDDMLNPSGQQSDSIILDTTLPQVTVSGGNVPKISKIVGKNTCSFSFQVDCIFTQYKVMVVANSADAHDAGTNYQIGVVNGSTNMSGSGTFAATTPVNCSIVGTDLELASAGDGQKTIKCFVLDESGQWSV